MKCQVPESEYRFKALEILTFHIRDLNGERRVQALGETVDFSICKSCAQKKLDVIRRPDRRSCRSSMAFGGVILLGIILFAVFFTDGAIRLMGLACMAGGAMGLMDTIRRMRAKSAKYKQLSPEEALNRAAWECAIEAAPKKSGENDLTYMPVNEKTLNFKNGDLMVLYDLLPEIAAQAWDKIREV